MHTAPCSPLDLFIGGCPTLSLSLDPRRVWACRRIPLNPGMIAHNRHAPALRPRASKAVRAGSQPGAPLIFLHSILISVTMSHCDLPSLPACSTSFLSTGRFSRSSAAAAERERERATVKVKDAKKYIRHRGRATSFPNNNQAGKQGRLASE